jgi:hypothetical protein
MLNVAYYDPDQPTERKNRGATIWKGKPVLQVAKLPKGKGSGAQIIEHRTDMRQYSRKVENL